MIKVEATPLPLPPTLLLVLPEGGRRLRPSRLPADESISLTGKLTG